MTDLDTSKEHGIVLYMDGGARPNPGHVGYGMHGYIFENVVIDKPVVLRNDFGSVPRFSAPTDKGYQEMTREGLPIPATAKPNYVTPLHYVDLCGTGLTIGTNNVAELKALFAALLLVRDTPGLSIVHLWLDSEYCLKAADKCAKGINPSISDFNPFVPNADLLAVIFDAYQQVLAKGMRPTHNWIKGHAGHFGNSHADWLATMGLMRYKDHNNEQHPYRATNEVVFSPAKKYWEAVTDRHPFLNYKRCYFNRLPEYNVAAQYYMADPGGVDEHIGKRVPDSGYGVIRLAEPDSILEMIRERQYDSPYDYNAVMMVKMEKAFSRDVARYMERYGKYALLFSRGQNSNLVFLDDSPVVVEQNPVGLMMRTTDGLAILEEHLDRFLRYKDQGTWVQPDNNQDFHFHDVTMDFFDDGVKKVGKEEVVTWTIKPTLVSGQRDYSVNVKEEHKGTVHDMKIPLILGIDMPPRNSLKQLEKLDPKVYLITWRESEYSLRYACVIQTKDGSIGIWSNYHADRLFFPKA